MHSSAESSWPCSWLRHWCPNGWARTRARWRSSAACRRRSCRTTSSRASWRPCRYEPDLNPAKEDLAGSRHLESWARVETQFAPSRPALACLGFPPPRGSCPSMGSRSRHCPVCHCHARRTHLRTDVRQGDEGGCQAKKCTFSVMGGRNYPYYGGQMPLSCQKMNHQAWNRGDGPPVLFAPPPQFPQGPARATSGQARCPKGATRQSE